jgi:hypothetical protein
MRWLVLAMIVFLGCRGESKSLDEILSLAKSRYESSRKAEVSEAVASHLQSLDSSISDFISSSVTAKDKAKEIAGLLDALTKKAGPTSRQPLHELTMQLLSAQSIENEAERKLLASRIFGVLSAELETVRFRYEELTPQASQ